MPESLNTFYFIPHTHWEGAVFQTREAYLEMGLPNILRALQLLKQHPSYRFVLDQACYVQPFLQRYPEEAATLCRFIAEGRLQITGGTDVMLDGNMPGRESYVRQVLYGKGYFRKALGVEVTTGWQLDTFGHHAQMPQLLKLAGFTSFWFARGVPSREVPSEFYWEGLDGSRIPAFWLPHSYALLYGSPKTLPEFTEIAVERYGWLAPFSRGPERVAVSGADVSEPEPHVPVIVEQFNQQPDRPFSLQLAVPAEFEAAVARRTDLPVIGGEMNPIFQGTYSSRIAVKQRTRALETLLTNVEALGAILAGLGVKSDQAEVWRAWEPMLFNQAHDLMSGVMTDHVYDDSLRGFDFAQRLGDELQQTRLQQLVEQIDTQGDGIPLVVCNTLGWSRSDIVITRVSFTDPAVTGVRLLGSDGREVPCQLLDIQRYADGGILQANLAFLAEEIPAMGFAVYHVLPSTTTDAQVGTTQAAPVLENEYYRLEVDPASGAITVLQVKDGAWNALRGPANVVAMESDHGDFWELYRPLDACSNIAMTDRHEPPQAGMAVFSTDQPAAPGTVTAGPVFSEFTVSHPFSEQGEFQTTIRLYAGLRRIDIRTHILNHDERVRYRALFPTAVQHGEYTHEIPFGAIVRPDGIEYPAQNWIDCGDGTRGITLLNRGLPGNNVANGTMMLSLMRSTSIVAYGYGGGYEPGMGSESGLELGKEFTFDYALVPHAGDWREAAVYRDGMAFNHPLIAMSAAPHAGTLPSRWGYLEISHPNVIVSSLKVSEDGRCTVLRVYEAAGMAVDDAVITFAGTLNKAEELNLLEDPLQPLAVDRRCLHVALKPFEIKTVGVDHAFSC